MNSDSPYNGERAMPLKYKILDNKTNKLEYADLKLHQQLLTIMKLIFLKPRASNIIKI